jgi:hypothetical protein
MMADLSRCSAEASRFEALGGAPEWTGAREQVKSSQSTISVNTRIQVQQKVNTVVPTHPTKCVSVRNYEYIVM